MACTVTGANTVSVNTGGAVVDGKVMTNSAAYAINIPSAVGGGNTRIDRIVARATWASYTVEITRIAGTDAASPTAPAITQTSGTTYDVTIAQVLVTTGGTCTVTDERDFASPAELAIAVLGNASSASVATWGAIAAASDHMFLARHGTSLGFQTVTSDFITSGAITVGKLATGAVTAGAYGADSIAGADIGTMIPVLTGRIGGSATDWYNTGGTGYTSAMNPRIAFGAQTSGAAGNVTVAFPVAFTGKPVCLATALSNVGFHVTVGTATTTQAQFVVCDANTPFSGTAGIGIHWLCIGPE